MQNPKLPSQVRPVGELIKFIRVHYCPKPTQEAFARRLGVSRNTVQNWESNSSLPSLKTVQLLVETFEIDDSLRQELEEAIGLKKTPIIPLNAEREVLGKYYVERTSVFGDLIRALNTGHELGHPVVIQGPPGCGSSSLVRMLRSKPFRETGYSSIIVIDIRTWNTFRTKEWADAFVSHLKSHRVSTGQRVLVVAEDCGNLSDPYAIRDAVAGIENVDLLITTTYLEIAREITRGTLIVQLGAFSHEELKLYCDLRFGNLRNFEMFESIITRTGAIPQKVQIVSNLIEELGWEKALHFFQTTEEPIAELRKLDELAFMRLDQNLQHRLTSLVFLPNLAHFEIDCVSSLWNVSERDATKVLGDIHKRSGLIEEDTDEIGPIWRLPGQVRKFLHPKLARETKKKVVYYSAWPDRALKRRKVKGQASARLRDGIRWFSQATAEDKRLLTVYLESSLTKDPIAFFRKLISQPKWSKNWEDLQPYIPSLSSSEYLFAYFLLKHELRLQKRLDLIVSTYIVALLVTLYLLLGAYISVRGAFIDIFFILSAAIFIVALFSSILYTKYRKGWFSIWNHVFND